MKRILSGNRYYCLIVVLIGLVQTTVNAQNVIIIEDCLQQAVSSYPLVRKYGLIEQSKEYSVNNIAKSYLPQISINAQTSYQSDVTELSLDLDHLPFDLDIPSLSKDQYRATVDITQKIWDGGVTNAQKELTLENSEIEKKIIDVSLQDVKSKVIELYFSILVIDKQLSLLDLSEKNLQTNRKVTRSMVDNGVATLGDIDLIDVELINNEKKKIEYNAKRKAYMKMLGLFLNQTLPDDILLHEPVVSTVLTKEINRPELQLYDTQNSLFDIRHKLIEANNMPKIGLFAQGGYGRPGLNMLEDKFEFFAVGGIRLTWNIGSLYTRKNDKRLIERKRQSTEVQRETFLFNTNIELTKEETEIQKFKELISKENEIVQLRTRIKEQSESKYRNGVYQINELIRDINSENQAMQNKVLHEIYYLMKIFNYNHIQGNK